MAWLDVVWCQTYRRGALVLSYCRGLELYTIYRTAGRGIGGCGWKPTRHTVQRIRQNPDIAIRCQCWQNRFMADLLVRDGSGGNDTGSCDKPHFHPHQPNGLSENTDCRLRRHRPRFAYWDRHHPESTNPRRRRPE